MPKIKIYHEDCYDQGEDSGVYWEYDCVKHKGEGCVCWGCESNHDDTTQWLDDYENLEDVS